MNVLALGRMCALSNQLKKKRVTGVKLLGVYCVGIFGRGEI